MGKNKLTKNDILHLAKLSALNLTDKEVVKIESQLDETLDYIENLKELDTDNVVTTNTVGDSKNIGFEDGEKCTRTLEIKKGFYKTKRIL